MDASKPTATTAHLQSLLRTNPRLKLEFMAGISKLFRDHEIDIAPEVLSRMTLGVEGGLSSSNADGPSPVPTPHDDIADGPSPVPTPRRDTGPISFAPQGSHRSDINGPS